MMFEINFIDTYLSFHHRVLSKWNSGLKHHLEGVFFLFFVCVKSDDPEFLGRNKRTRINRSRAKHRPKAGLRKLRISESQFLDNQDQMNLS